MRPAPLVLAFVALAAAVGVGWLVVGSSRTQRQAGSEEARAERIGPVPASLAPTTAMPTDADEPGAVAPEESESSGSEEGPSGARGARDTIRGRVVGAPAELRGHLEVVATPLDVARFASTALCDSEDRFELTGLTRGTTYHLRAFAAGRASFGRARTELRVARPGERGVELAWLPEQALVFQVADARTGLPVTEFEVRLGRQHLRPLLDRDGRIRKSFPEGRVRWVDWAEEEEREPFEVVLSARGYRELRVGALVKPPRTDYDLGRLLLEPAPHLVVRVVEEATQLPVEGAMVTLKHAVDRERPRDAQAFDPHAERTDAEGRATLACFPGEEAVLSVRHSRYADLERTLMLSLAEEQLETVQLALR